MSELAFELPGGGRAVFTSRAEGNMSSVGGAGCAQGEANRAATCARIGARGLARGYQVHGTVVRRVLQMPDPPLPAGRPEDADGQATCVPALAAMVLAADCLPVAIGCEGAVAAVHAGWRGLAAGVLAEGVAAVRELAGSTSAPLAAVIGPGAGRCCYEVGPEVLGALGLEGDQPTLIDLAALARRQLEQAGVASVRATGICTICDQRFFSHRREGERAGRMAGLAWLS